MSINDQALYRLYAVGKITYDQALRHADSEFKLRRALLQFDQVSKQGRPQAAEPARTTGPAGP